LARCHDRESDALRIFIVLTEKRDDRRAKSFGGGAPANPAERERASRHG
jgi:hypothetical protein